MILFRHDELKKSDIKKLNGLDAKTLLHKPKIFKLKKVLNCKIGLLVGFMQHFVCKCCLGNAVVNKISPKHRTCFAFTCLNCVTAVI